MKLKLIDTITLENIIPIQGNMKQMILFEDIKKKVHIIQKELKDYEIEVLQYGIKWNDKGNKAEFDIDFSELEENEIKTILKKLDTENRIDMQCMVLCRLFKLI